MTAYLFPGQGSQSRGMGEVLFAEFPNLVDKANQILGYSIEQLCLENPNENLNQTQFTQPALFIVNALSYLKKIKDGSQKPNYVAGHSLGEYNALFAANVFDFETGLKLIQKRSELMSKATGGKMAAVVGLKNNKVAAILQCEGFTDVSIANYNSYTQVVISGSKDSITALQPIFEQAGAILYLPLNVSGAFHSPYMQDAAQTFKQFLEEFNFNIPTIKVVANVTAQLYQTHEIKLQLTKQITEPVQWVSIIEYLFKQGETNLIEIGPGTVLTSITQRIKNGQ